MEKGYFTSEAVTEGHPDKIADQISDAILDTILKADPHAVVNCATTIAAGLVLVSGKINTECYVDIPKIVRATIRQIGYNRSKFGFDCDTCAVLTAIDDQGHGPVSQQGVVFGYACDETPELMPLSVQLAQSLARQLAEARKSRSIPYLRPDGKTQVTLAYEDGKPAYIDTIVIAAQHKPDVATQTMVKDIRQQVVDLVLPKELINAQTRILINPTGRFVIGGPKGDSGLSGRKAIADAYGGAARYGGQALSGKDPSHINRFGNYAARWLAKNIVAAGLASRCEVQLAFVAGEEIPVAVTVNTFGTGRYADLALTEAVRSLDLRVNKLIEQFRLKEPAYFELATYGHFGRQELSLPWEQISPKYLSTNLITL